jgi:hypothetical protein
MANKKFRVLRETELDGKTYKPDTVLVIDEQLGKSLEGAGAVDGNAAAVAYCEKTLEKEAVTHKKPAADAETAEAAK